MREGLMRAITDEEIRTYEEDGIACLRQFFDRGWVERLRAVTAARGLAKRHVPSTLVIHRQDGSVQTRSSYDENAST